MTCDANISAHTSDPGDGYRCGSETVDCPNCGKDSGFCQQDIQACKLCGKKLCDDCMEPYQHNCTYVVSMYKACGLEVA